MKNVDVVVVGGGLIGMLSARELRQSGLSVALVERNTTGRESSWAGGGILSPLYPWRYDDAVTQLARSGQASYPSLLHSIHQESGVDPEYQSSGLLILDTDEQAQALDWAKRWDVLMQVVKGQPHLHEIEPALAAEQGEGLWFADVGQVRNPKLVSALRQSLLNQGVALYENCPLDKLLIEKGQVKGIQTACGKLIASKVVIAGGAWTRDLLAETGVNLEVKPVRGQMILFKAVPGVVSRIVLSRDRYVIPRRDGRVLVGSTLEDVGFEKLTTNAARVELHEEAIRLVPGLENYPIEHHWAGLRPGTPQGIPYICEHPAIAGLFVNAGHYRNGVVLGPASCHLLSQLVLQHVPDIDPAPYAIPFS